MFSVFRIRRYRLFLFATALAVAAVYHLTKVNKWDVPELQSLPGLGFKHDIIQTIIPDTVPLETSASTAVVPAVPTLKPALSFTSTPAGPAAAPHAQSSTSTSPPSSDPTVTGEEFLAKQPSFEEEFGQHGHGRYDVKPHPSDQPRAYWKPQNEHFPVPAEKLIQLPLGNARPLPAIQFAFDRETSTKKNDRLRKQAIIKASFQHAWSGYKTYAMGHDELKPVSNATSDPFNGWGATLVDSLDTLWIMGLQDDFDEAIEAVGRIDFKTSARKDIPLFETTIRYLGGLIAAYDVSGAKYTILLDKAVELADILMGAFDTPNRMPIPYYNWAPSYASQPHRSHPHTVMSELGSLSVEFTRLAQLTKEAKYYDAIARVTDALQDLQQNTSMPGIWPLALDSSGCRKPELEAIRDAQIPLPGKATANVQEQDLPGMDKTHTFRRRSDSRAWKKRHADDAAQVDPGDPSGKTKEPGSTEEKVQIVDGTLAAEDAGDSECEVQGLSLEPNSKTHSYSIGARADSTYEYFPKQYALLGGLNDQYRTMYLDSMSIVRDEILYRPMVKEKRDILFPAMIKIAPKAERPADRRKKIYEASHLGCFAGGMFALGAKVFGVETDLKIAKKLTDGCVWAYESTPLGIMPEEFELVPCESQTSCEWNETRWHDYLDPQLKERFEAVEMYNTNQQRLREETALEDAGLEAAEEIDPSGGSDPLTDPTPKRQNLKVRGDSALMDSVSTKITSELVADGDIPALAADMFVPKVAMSHEKFVTARILEERLPPGYTNIRQRAYKLRPEAIESVFLMYRITGEEYWREKGWTMFSATERATKTSAGNAMVKDVTSQLMELEDVMESFWLAETLKYYYLLFSEPELISLDDYVLNTEAHPFRLPK